MKLVTKIKLSYLAIVAIVIQSLITYSDVSSIGSEIVNSTTAREDVVTLTSKVQLTAEAELAQNMETLSHEASEVKTILTVMADIAVQASDKTVNDFENTGRNVGEINTISATNARSVEEIAAAAEHLNTLTDELNRKLENFRT